jgi:predicted RNA methylase
MKQKKLEIILQQRVKPFAKPKIQLEQYHTPPHICAAVVHCMYEQGDVEDLSVVDLGCGTGMLGIACCLMGAERVVGVDVDKDALATLQENLAEFDEDDEVQMEFVNQNVEEYTEQCDVVVMNPPFGTRDKGADMRFLVAASKIGKVVYSMHKSTTRKHVEKTGKACGMVGKPIAELRYNLDKTHDFHKKGSVDIRVDLWRFEKE